MKTKRLLSLLLCAALMLTLAPATAFALDMQNGLPTFAVNTASATTVGFGDFVSYLKGAGRRPSGSAYDPPAP